MIREREMAFTIVMMVVTVSFMACVGGTDVKTEENGVVPPDGVADSTIDSGWNVWEQDTPMGLSGFNFERYGGWWSDAEKVPGDDGIGNPPPYNPGEEDDKLCWAATASNMLEFTGWGFVDGMDTSDEMLDYFEAHVSDEGSNILYALVWWDIGYLAVPNGNFAYEDVEGGGFWLDVSMAPYIHYNEDTAESMKEVEVNTASNRACGLSIKEINGDGGHAITAWGVCIDDTIQNINDPARYKGVWITDSDSNKGDPFAEDYLGYFNVTWSADNNYWYLPNYGSGWYIKAVTGLDVFPFDTRPVADIFIGSDLREGEEVAFGGGFSQDADGDQLSYRWDFDGNGTWDTDWSIDPTVSHTWDDEYTGTVYLQVFDGRLTDMIGIDVNIVNVAPDVTLSGDLVVEEGSLSTILVQITDPGPLDSFTIEVNWDDGTVETYYAYSYVRSFYVDHRYTDDNPTGTPYDEYVVVVRIRDDDGGYGSARRSVMVDNIAPKVISKGMVQPDPYFILPLVHTVQFYARFTDVGVMDTHTADWFWGDQTSDDGTIVEHHGSGNASASHVWSQPGTYIVMVFITDDDTEYCLDQWTVVVVAADQALNQLDSYIQGLPSSAFGGTPSNVMTKKAILHSLVQMDINMVKKHDYRGARSFLLGNVRTMMDGLPISYNRMSVDMINDPIEQKKLCLMNDDIARLLSQMR
jgi:hypothetical protein